MARKRLPPSAIDTSSVLDGSAMVANLIPGPIGNIATIGIAPFQGSAHADKELNEINDALDMDIRREKNKSPGIRKKLTRMANYWQERTTEAVVSLAGGAAGMAITGMLLPAGLPFLVPLLISGAGAVGGGLMANKAYNSAFPREDQDAVRITIQLYQLQKAGSAVTPEAVFAALAANLHGRAGKKLENELERLAGTRDFNEALSQQQFDALHHLMKKYDPLISNHYPQLPENTSNLEETTSERYAQLINARKINASSLLKPEELRMSVMQLEYQAMMPQQHAPDMQASLTPHSGLPPMKRGVQLSAN